MVQLMPAGLMAPLYFKRAVDSLAGRATHAASIAAVTALAWSGACRVVNGLAKEIQHPVFTPVSQVSENASGPPMLLLHDCMAY